MSSDDGGDEVLLVFAVRGRFGSRRSFGVGGALSVRTLMVTRFGGSQPFPHGTRTEPPARGRPFTQLRRRRSPRVREWGSDVVLDRLSARPALTTDPALTRVDLG